MASFPYIEPEDIPDKDTHIRDFLAWCKKNETGLSIWDVYEEHFWDWTMDTFELARLTTLNELGDYLRKDPTITVARGYIAKELVIEWDPEQQQQEIKELREISKEQQREIKQHQQEIEELRGIMRGLHILYKFTTSSRKSSNSNDSNDSNNSKNSNSSNSNNSTDSNDASNSSTSSSR